MTDPTYFQNVGSVYHYWDEVSLFIYLLGCKVGLYDAIEAALACEVVTSTDGLGLGPELGITCFCAIFIFFKWWWLGGMGGGCLASTSCSC